MKGKNDPSKVSLLLGACDVSLVNKVNEMLEKKELKSKICLQACDFRDKYVLNVELEETEIVAEILFLCNFTANMIEKF